MLVPIFEDFKFYQSISPPPPSPPWRVPVWSFFIRQCEVTPPKNIVIYDRTPLSCSSFHLRPLQNTGQKRFR